MYISCINISYYVICINWWTINCQMHIIFWGIQMFRLKNNFCTEFRRTRNRGNTTRFKGPAVWYSTTIEVQNAPSLIVFKWRNKSLLIHEQCEPLLLYYLNLEIKKWVSHFCVEGVNNLICTAMCLIYFTFTVYNLLAYI